MARPMRINYPGAFYHVTSRGNERNIVFKSKHDRDGKTRDHMRLRSEYCNIH